MVRAGARLAAFELAPSRSMVCLPLNASAIRSDLVMCLEVFRFLIAGLTVDSYTQMSSRLYSKNGIS